MSYSLSQTDKKAKSDIMRKKLHFFIFFLCLLIATIFSVLSCGNRKTPTGGPIDLVKPVLLFTEPLIYEQIEKNEIAIAFSKPMDKISVMNGIVVSPQNINKKMIWKKNVLHITFTEKLTRDRNVYVTLTKTIRCERNNNLEDNIYLIFRNGTLQQHVVNGIVTAEDLVYSNKEIRMSLLDSDSLLVYNKIVNDKFYKYEYLNPGKYSIISYIDHNNNNRYDFGNDPFGTANFEIPTIENINITLAVVDTVKPNITNISSPANNQIIVSFNKDLAYQPIIFIVNDSTKVETKILHSEWVKRDLYLITTELDSTSYKIQISDITDLKRNNTATITKHFISHGTFDRTPLKLIDIYPKNGSVINNTQPILFLTFNKIIFSQDIKLFLNEIESNSYLDISTIDKAGFSFKYNILGKLKDFNTYQLVLAAETRDSVGNTLDEGKIVQFIVTH